MSRQASPHPGRAQTIVYAAENRGKQKQGLAPRETAKRDCRKIGGTTASWMFSRLFSDQGWMRGLDVEVGENRG